jgi:hypothetical protein
VCCEGGVREGVGGLWEWGIAVARKGAGCISFAGWESGGGTVHASELGVGGDGGGSTFRFGNVECFFLDA